MNVSVGYFSKETDVKNAVKDELNKLESQVDISKLENCTNCSGKGYYIYYFPESVPCITEDGHQGWQYAGWKMCGKCNGTGKYISLKEAGEFF